MLLIAGALSFLLIAQPQSRPGGLLRDFNAFYCAGSAIAHHADPYRNEPLGACERDTPRAAFLLSGHAGLAVPAPLPPYALAPFALLSALPYDLAALLWTLFLAASYALTVRCLYDLTKFPLSTIIAATALGDLYVGVTLGQVAPVAIAAVTVAAWATARENEMLASLAAAIAMIEPHIGLPACLACAAFRPRTFGMLALYAAALAGLSWAIAGPINLEYIKAVLPAHASSELFNGKQLSLTALLARLGLPERTALTLGTIGYATALGIGWFAARSLVRRTRRAELGIVIPIAFAAIGSPFIHIAQIAVVTPTLLLLLDAEAESEAAPLLRAALLLTAIPWVQFISLGASFPFLAAIAVGTLAHTLFPESKPSRTAILAMLGFLLAYAPSYLVETLPQRVADTAAMWSDLVRRYDPAALAETSWTAYVRATGQEATAAYDSARAFTWIGLVTFIAGLARTPGASTEKN